MVTLFKMLANGKRIDILYALINGELRVEEISTTTNIAFATVSDYLNKMRARGLVKARQHGTNMYYSLRDANIAMILSSCNLPR